MSFSRERQMFFMTENEELRLLSNCIDAGKKTLSLFPCHRLKGNQQFIYRPDNTIFHPSSEKCVQWIENAADLALYPCDRNPRQMWMWEKMAVNILPKNNTSVI